MPQIYRRHSEYVQPSSRSTLLNSSNAVGGNARRNSSRSPQPQATDADDGIFLSDLVRTGEASRLRRRGAMRIDHASRSAVVSNPPLPPPRPIITMAPSRPSTPPWITSEPSGEDEYTYSNEDFREYNPADESGDTSAAAAAMEDIRRDGAAGHTDSEEAFMLFCGGPMRSLDSDEDARSFEPSVLPNFPSKASSSTTPRSHSTKNGCGALVHMQAFPQKPRGVWVGKEEATEVVVGLDASYFERSVVAKMLKSACGCIREGIGCAVCGNTLGTRYLPCQAASTGFFCSSATSTHPPRSRPITISSPRYWDPRWAQTSARSSSSQSPRSFYVYTFFGDHVTPAPAHAQPRKSVPKSTSPLQTRERMSREAPPMRRSSSIRSVSPGVTSTDRNPNLWLNYSYTTPGATVGFSASPRPLTPVPLPGSPPTPGAPVIPPAIPATLPTPPSRRPQRRLEVAIPLAVSRRRSTRRLVNNSSNESDSNTVVNNTDDDTWMEEGEVAMDADGVVIGSSEPNSPDKVGNEVMMWPGR